MKNCMNCGNGPWRDGKEECRWCSWSYRDFSGDPTRWKPKEDDMFIMGEGGTASLSDEKRRKDRYWATERRKDFKTPCNQDCCDPGGAEKTEPTGGVYWEKPIEEPKTSDEHWERLSGLFTAMDLSKSQMIAGLWYLYKAALKHGRCEND
jgi:hypothetical protein